MAPRSQLLAGLLTAVACLRPALADKWCPPLETGGHAPDQEWTFSNLNWTKVSGNDGFPSNDIIHVTFDIKSPFNNAPVSCEAQGAEFGEEYERDALGQPVSYNWYKCNGPNKEVLTEFRLKWWVEHNLEIRQTWTCNGAPYRATGAAVILGTFDCEYGSRSERLWCRARKGADQKAITATTVNVLPPPTRDCAAASQSTPDWTISDLVFVDGFSPDNMPWPLLLQNITLRVTNKALNYSPLLVCQSGPTATNDVLDPNHNIWWPCSLFEANPNDVPETKFNWIRTESVLRIDQTWWCNSGANKKTFHSIGEKNINSTLQCTSDTHTFPGSPYFNETIRRCTAPPFVIKGTLK